MRNFETFVDLLKKYKKEHGNLLVQDDYITPDGIRLGRKVSDVRRGRTVLYDDEITALNNLGFIWKVHNSPVSFNKVIKLLVEYKKSHNESLAISERYVTPTGIPLGQIAHNIRCGSRHVSNTQRAKLDDIGFIWKPVRYNKKQ